MRILLVRHGHVNEEDYIVSDINAPLSKEGWLQARGVGRFLRDGPYKDQKKWPFMYESPYVRVEQTSSGVYHVLKDVILGKPKRHPCPILSEKYHGARGILENPEQHGIDKGFAENFRKLSRIAYERDPFVTRTPLGDSDKDVLDTTEIFINGTFSRDIKDGNDDFLLIFHGARARAFLLKWAHLDVHNFRDIPIPGNCDVIEITGESRNWNIRKIYDGPSYQAVDIDILEGLRPRDVQDFPEPPDFFFDS